MILTDSIAVFSSNVDVETLIFNGVIRPKVKPEVGSRRLDLGREVLATIAVDEFRVSIFSVSYLDET